MKVENWSPENDTLLKPGERRLHQLLHSQRSEKTVPWQKTLKHKERRWRTLQESIERIGGIRGTILEVGAGDGWCSAALLRHYRIEHSYIMEIDEAAIESLIPNTLETFGVAGENVTLVLGSFNEIPLEDHFDVVIAMGALHHSSNLFATLRSIWRSLKPGGYLLSQEPSMANHTPNRYYSERNEEINRFPEGIELKNEERTDIFYRECEYLTAAHHSGFDVSVRDVSDNAEESKPGMVKRFFRSVASDKACDTESWGPRNVFIEARKPERPVMELPPTAWEMGLVV